MKIFEFFQFNQIEYTNNDVSNVKGLNLLTLGMQLLRPLRITYFRRKIVLHIFYRCSGLIDLTYIKGNHHNFRWKKYVLCWQDFQYMKP